MKRHLRIAPVVVSLSLSIALLPSGLLAEEKFNPVGTWQLHVMSPGRPPSSPILKLESTGGKLVGVLTDDRGRSTPVRDVEVKDGELSFRVTFDRGGQSITMIYKAKPVGDGLKGKMNLTFGTRKIAVDFDGKRVKEEGTLAGLWKITLLIESGEKLQPSVRLKQAGDKWTGAYINIAGKEIQLQEVKFKDGQLSFKVPEQFEQEKVTLHYDGKVTGEKIGGTVTFGSGKQTQSMKFQADKVKTPTVSLAGTWKLLVRLKSGETFEPTLKLAQTGISLTGTYLGEQGETPIADALVLGDEFIFEVARDRDGKKYRLKYQGKVKGDTITGSVDYNFDGIAGFVDFDGKRIAK